MSADLIDMPQVLALTGGTGNTLLTAMRSRAFPLPAAREQRAPGPKTRLWTREAVLAWVAEHGCLGFRPASPEEEGSWTLRLPVSLCWTSAGGASARPEPIGSTWLRCGGPRDGPSPPAPARLLDRIRPCGAGQPPINGGLV